MPFSIKENVLHYYRSLIKDKQFESCEYSLHNIIRTMNISRHSYVCGEDFSNLDWGNIPLNEVFFSNNGNDPCDFSGCKLNKWNFIRSPRLGHIAAVSYSHNGKIIGVADFFGTVVLWDSNSSLMIQEFCGFVVPKVLAANAVIINFSHDNRHCMICYDNKTVFQYDINTGKYIRTFILDDKLKNAIIKERHDDIYNKLEKIQNSKLRHSLYDFMCTFSEARFCFSPDGLYYVIGFSSGIAMVFDTKTDICTKKLMSFSNLGEAISISPDEKYLLAGSYHNDTAQLWNIRTGKFIQQLEGYPVSPIAFSGNSLLCITDYEHGTIKIWETNSKNCISTFIMPDDARSNSYELSPNGKYVLSYHETLTTKHDKKAKAYLYSIISSKIISLESISEEVVTGCFFPNSDKLMLFFSNGLLKICSIKTRKCIKVLEIHNKTKTTFSNSFS